VTTGVHSSQVQVSEEECRQRNGVTADEEPNSHALTAVDNLGGLVVTSVVTTVAVGIMLTVGIDTHARTSSSW
jgi:hypothetical protein